MLPDVAMLLQPMWHMHCMWQALLAHFLLESNCELFIACELCDVHTSDSRKAHWTKAQDMLFEPRLKKSSCSCKQSCPHKITLLTLISFFCHFADYKLIQFLHIVCQLLNPKLIPNPAELCQWSTVWGSIIIHNPTTTLLLSTLSMRDIHLHPHPIYKNQLLGTP